jgi:hypothetical protein
VGVVDRVELKFVLDNCISRKIGEALRCVGENVHHLTDLSIPENTPDHEWLERLSPEGLVLMTGDQMISRKINESAAFIQGNWLGYSFSKMANENAWKQFEEVVRVFSGLKLHAKKDAERPGFYRVDGPKSFIRLGKIKKP